MTQRMLRLFRVPLAAFLLGALAMGAAAQSGKGVLNGVVLNAAGGPVAKAGIGP